MRGAPLHPDVACAVVSFSHSAYMCILIRKFCDQVTIHKLQLHLPPYRIHPCAYGSLSSQIFHPSNFFDLFFASVTSVKKCLLQFPKELRWCMQFA